MISLSLLPNWNWMRGSKFKSLAVCFSMTKYLYSLIFPLKLPMLSIKRTLPKVKGEFSLSSVWKDHLSLIRNNWKLVRQSLVIIVMSPANLWKHRAKKRKVSWMKRNEIIIKKMSQKGNLWFQNLQFHCPASKKLINQYKIKWNYCKNRTRIKRVAN